MNLLLRQARLPSGPASVLVTGGRVAWIGPDQAVPQVPPSTAVHHLGGRLLLPAFVDAHAHVTETGLFLNGVQLAGLRSAGQILDAVARAAAARPGQPVLGHGWDELRLDRSRLPDGAELDRAADGADVYLTRVDVHSALVSATLARRLNLAAMDG